MRSPPEKRGEKFDPNALQLIADWRDVVNIKERTFNGQRDGSDEKFTAEVTPLTDGFAYR